LRRRLGDHSLVGEIRGCGLLAGVQLVRSKAPKAFFPPDFGAGRQWAEAAETRGLLVRAIGDTIALCPPLVITESEIAELIDRLAMALGDVEHQLAAVS
jgi:4-aminobutyrate--pyruvate transaminase